MRLRLLCPVAATLCAAAASTAAAHPMGNFSISHYARIVAAAGRLRVRYVLDLAEIPTIAERSAMGDGAGGITAAARSAYLRRAAAELAAGLQLTAGGTPVHLSSDRADLAFRPGAGGLPTMRLALDLSATMPFPSAGQPTTIRYRDGNYAERTGWKEIVAVAAPGGKIIASTAPAFDRSHELASYPTDAMPPQDLEATFTFAAAGVPSARHAADAAGALTAAVPAAGNRGPTPRDSFTQVIARADLTPGWMAAGLGLAMLFGALHALSPGHGKAMVAAYLVGARGTARHALLLGLTVTVTHTAGVFALGAVTLFASRYVVPERLYPILSAVSGVAVLSVGISLLRSRLAGIRRSHRPDEPQPHPHPHPHWAQDSGRETLHTYDHPHGHAHHYGHAGHEHYHAPHGHGHEAHAHDHHHHHVPDGPVTVRSLIALGVSGGLAPCPSALIVLLSAVALHRIGYGLALISAFSVGLAAVLVAIGLAVVWARGLFERLPAGGRALERLPVFSALAITVVGLLLIARAFTAVP